MSNAKAEKTPLLSQVGEWLIVFAITSVVSLLCNMVGYEGGLDSIPGLLIFAAIGIAGMIIAEFMPGNLPAICYVAVIAMLIASPISPIADTVLYFSNKIALMAVVTPILAYAGVLVGKDWNIFLKIGWRGIIVSLLVILGTFFVSSGIAEVLTRLFA